MILTYQLIAEADQVHNMETILTLSGITAAIIFVLNKYNISTPFLNKCVPCKTFEVALIVWVLAVMTYRIITNEYIEIWVNPFSIWMPSFFMGKLLNQE